MKQTSTPTKRLVTQGITLAIIIIATTLTWLNNEQKTQPTNTPEKTQTSTTNIEDENMFRHYDTIMANDRLGQNIVPVDYYMLSLSWSPSFCEEQKHKHHGKLPKHLEFQCNQAAEYGWVIHGLWPQSAKARQVSEHPRFCQGDLPPLAPSLIKPYLADSPGAGLLQGQWEKHGACAFERAEEYFAKQQTLFHSLNLPGQELSRHELFQWMKKFNPSLKNVRLNANRNELYICYDKQWQPTDCQ